MSFLVANIPPIKCFVRAEFLYNQERRHGELEPCFWISAKAIKGQAFRIECMLTDYGALYDKLPINAFVWKPVEEYLPLDNLQIWDCLGYDMAVIEKSNLRGLKVKYYGKDREFHLGNYLFTIDFASPDHNRLDVTFTEGSQEHKSYNFIKLDNGQFACQPNNRCLWYDVSLVPNELKTPDFKIPTDTWSVENVSKWSTAGDDSWFYQFKETDREIVVVNDKTNQKHDDYGKSQKFKQQ
jgi:hypothetical protein